MKSYSFCLNFNIRFFHTLSQVLIPELEDGDFGEIIPNGAPAKIMERISATCRRALPVLRLCSIWLAANGQKISAYVLKGQDSPVVLSHSHVLEMWNSHAAVLSKLIGYFKGSDVKISPYMLEEDETTVGFAPFRSADIPPELRMHFVDDGTPKPRVTDDGVKRNHPNEEMHSRVADLLIIGYKLQASRSYPVVYKEEVEKFAYDEGVLKSMAAASPSFSASSGADSRSARTHSEPSEFSRNQPRFSNDDTSPGSPFGFVSNNIEDQMSAMVQSLVDARVEERGRHNQHVRHPSNGNDTFYGMNSTMAQEVFGPMGTNPARQYTPKHFPRIPGVDGTFAPLPNELSPSAAARQFPRAYSPYSTPEGRLAAAKELDRVTGYTQHSSWNQQSSPMPPGFQLFGANHKDVEANTITNFDTSGFEFRTPCLANAQPSSIGNTPLRNGSTIYPGATNFDTETMLRSSPWVSGQRGYGAPYSHTPPAGQARNGD